MIQGTLIISIIWLLTLIIGYTHAIIDLQIILFAAGLWTVLGLFWILFGQKVQTPFKLPFIVWICAYILTVVFSIDPRRSAGQMLIMSTSIFLFLLVYDLVYRGWPAKFFIYGLMLASLIITFAGLFEFANWYRNWLHINPGDWLPGITFRPAAANVLAPFNYFSGIFSLYYLYKNRKKLHKIAFLLIFLLSNAMLFITSSRGGWLGAAAGYGLILLLIGVREKSRIQKVWNQLKAKPILLSSGIIILAAILLGAGFILYKQAIHPTHGSILNSRKLFWQIALKTFFEKPIFGQGQFTYGTAFLKSTSVPPDLIWVHAHNSYLNLLAEMGISGLIAFLFLTISILRAFIAKLKICFHHNDVIMFPAAAFLSAFAIHTFFDSLHMEPALIWTLVILLAAVLATPKEAPLTEIKMVRWQNLWVMLPLLASWYFIWIIYPFHQGVSLANQNQWEQAKDNFEMAILRDPGSALAHQQLALADSVLVSQGNSENLSEAIIELKKTIAIEPGWALNYANLSALLAAAGDFKEAQSTVELAVDLAPRVAMYHIALGRYAEDNQDFNTAENSFLTAMDLEPSWYGGDFWSESTFRQDIQKKWLDNNPAKARITFADAKANLENNPQSTWAYNQLASAYIVEGDLEKAKSLLENASLAYSGHVAESIETTWLQAELLAAQGNIEGASVLGEKAINNYQAYGIYGPGSFGLLYYAPRMFRMPAMALEIVPQMIKPLTPQIWVEREKQLQYWQEKQ